MQPSEALSASAQVAVTLAGFAGVVVAFRSGSIHEWSKIDKFRLRILLMNSAMPFVLSIFGMILLSTNLEATMVWRLCSLIAFVLIILIGPRSARSSREFTREEFKTSGAKRPLFYVSAFIGIAATFLQLYNFIRLQTFWPFFVAIATFLMLGMLQFVLLVIAGHESDA
jgi:hypothetical protein